MATLDEVGNTTTTEHAMDSVQQSEGKCCASEDGGEIEMHDSQKFEVGGERENKDSVGPDCEPSNNLEVNTNKNWVVESIEPSDDKFCSDNGLLKLDDAKLVVEESQDRNSQEQFSKMSCGESVSEVEKNQGVVNLRIQSVNDEPCSDRQDQLVCELNEK